MLFYSKIAPSLFADLPDYLYLYCMKDEKKAIAGLTEDTACDLLIVLWELSESAKKIQAVISECVKHLPLNED